MIRTDRGLRRRFDPDSRHVAILEATAAAFAVHPYVEVTTSSVVAEAYSSNALVYRYLANKEDPCAEIVRMAITDPLTRQTEALDILPDGIPMRDRIQAATMVYLDHIVTHPDARAMPMRRPGGELVTVAELRARIHCDYVKRLQDLLIPGIQVRHDYALWGCFGFVDAAALRRVGEGCPGENRWVFIDAVLDALEGALDDWAVQSWS